MSDTGQTLSSFILYVCESWWPWQDCLDVHACLIMIIIGNILFQKFLDIQVLISCLLICLFDLMLNGHSKQLRSCWDGQLLNHTVPGQASRRQFTSIKCPFSCQ